LFFDPFKQTSTSSESSQNYCFGFEPLNTGKIYFGGTWMKNYDILFDWDNKNVKLTPSNCLSRYHLPENISKIVSGAEDVEII
jgi:hypothetical protein